MQNWRYHGFSASAVALSFTIASTRERIWFIFSKSASSIVLPTSWPALPVWSCCTMMRSLRMMSVQPSITRSSSWKPPDTRMLKLSIRCLCQPCLSDLAQPGSVSRFARTSIDDGVRWNTYSCSAVSPTCGTHCTAVAPVPITATRLPRRPVRFPSEFPPV